MQRITLLAAATLAAATAWAAPVETRAYYSTNADGAVGKSATITIDGEFSDWSEDMIIATCGANDRPPPSKAHTRTVSSMHTRSTPPGTMPTST